MAINMGKISSIFHRRASRAESQRGATEQTARKSFGGRKLSSRTLAGMREFFAGLGKSITNSRCFSCMNQFMNSRDEYNLADQQVDSLAIGSYAALPDANSSQNNSPQPSLHSARSSMSGDPAPEAPRNVVIEAEVHLPPGARLDPASEAPIQQAGASLGAESVGDLVMSELPPHRQPMGELPEAPRNVVIEAEVHSLPRRESDFIHLNALSVDPDEDIYDDLVGIATASRPARAKENIYSDMRAISASRTASAQPVAEHIYSDIGAVGGESPASAQPVAEHIYSDIGAVGGESPARAQSANERDVASIDDNLAGIQSDEDSNYQMLDDFIEEPANEPNSIPEDSGPQDYTYATVDRAKKLTPEQKEAIENSERQKAMEEQQATVELDESPPPVPPKPSDLD